MSLEASSGVSGQISPYIGLLDKLRKYMYYPEEIDMAILEGVLNLWLLPNLLFAC